MPVSPHDPRPPIARRSPGEEQFRVFIETVRDYAMLILDLDGNIATWNAGAESIKGWKGPEIIGKHFSTFYTAEAILSGLPERELEGALRDGRYEDESWRVRKDGTQFWANVVITALRDADGTPIGFAKVTRDLTERRRHEESVRNSEARFRSLIEGVRDYAIFMLDPTGRVATWNTGAQNIMGYSAGEILGEHLTEFYPHDGRETELAERELRTARVDGRFEDEGWRVRKDGSRFWANAILTAIRDASGQLIGFSKVTRDLTDRLERENQLRQSEARFRLLVESVYDYAIITVDDGGFVSSWNSGAQHITGFSSVEAVGRHFSQLYPPEDVSNSRPWQHLARARDGQRVNEEGWRIRKDGSQFWANSVIAKLPESAAADSSYYIVMQDLSQRRHAESLADSAQKIHEFIAMLAHELRNPLAPIRNAVSLMQRRNISDPVVESMRQMIDRQSNQLGRIIDELLDVNRVARGHFTMDKQVLDLRAVLERSIETSRPLIETKQHELVLDLADQTLNVNGDPLRLQQVIVNLLNNAAKYTPNNGRILLSARREDNQVVIRVRDTGKGIARESIDRVFDMFMQIDPNAPSSLGGLGVGLALVKRIVELHGGRVSARSDGLGLGAEFTVLLPLSSDALAPTDRSVESPEIAGRLRVLVVDDNVDAADSLGMFLGTLDQNVRSVYDGATALRETEAFRPHLVLLDIGMPDMNGYDVARAIRASNCSPVPVLVAVTGWGQETDKTRARDAGFDQHFVKPISDAALRKLIGEVSVERAMNQSVVIPLPTGPGGDTHI